MHRCLFIPEIVCLLCDELGNMGANSSLAKLAQTCLAFNEPALNVLWYQLEDLLPLIQCMPRDLWSIGQGEIVTFQRPIVPTDWERFEYHAGRVREFVYYDVGHIEACDVFETLSIGSTRDLLLPKLRELWWDIGEGNGLVFPCIRHFLGPHIIRLHISTEGMSGPDSDKFIRRSLLHTLASQYPTLSHLDLIDDQDSVDCADLVDCISDAVCGWTQLRQLSVRGLSPNALHHIAALPTLEWLTLTNVTEDILLPLFPRSSTVRFFPCLQDLEVACDVASFAIGLVEVISSIALASISVASLYFGQTGYQDLINALRDRRSRSSLKSIYISGDHLSIPTSIDVKPLFVFTDLTNIELGGSGARLELDDTSLTDMALSWPQINSLILRGSSRATLRGLVPLAQYCLQLRHLDIFFNPNSVPPQDIQLFTVKNEVLRIIDVSHHPDPFFSIFEPERVAAFIHGIFPRAQLSYRVGSQWNGVASAVDAYLQGRG